MKIYFTNVSFDKKLLFRTVARKAFKILGQPDKIELYVSFISAEEMLEINSETRGIDAVTDVLSFPSLDLFEGEIVSLDDAASMNHDSGCVILGEIAICTTIAESQATMYGHSTEREYAFLFLHGLLHLFGYDHSEPEEQERMEAMQRRILDEVRITRDDS